MNDYFTAVAARNLGFVRPVQPRIPSLYEPPVPMEADGASTEPELQVALESNALQVDNAPATGISHPFIKVPDEPSAIRGLEHEEEDSFVAHAEAAAPQVPARSDAGRESVTPDISESDAPMPAPAASVRVNIVKRAERREAGREEALPVTPAETVAVQAEAPELTAELGRLASPAKSSEPSIRVTIGRIEVTAIAPAPVAKKAKTAPAASRLSLEEYLKKEREGRH
jgi:hypothetical protein